MPKVIAFGWQLAHEGRALMTKISALIQEMQESHLDPLL